MTAKNYLNQIYNLRFKIMRLEKENDRLRYYLEGGAIVYDKAKVQTSPSDQTSEVMAEIADNAAKIKEMRSKVDMIVEQIDGMHKPMYARMLSMIYFSDYTVAEVANVFRYSYSRAKHIHLEALEAFENQYLKGE